VSNLPAGWINVQLGDVVDYGNTSKAEPTEIAEDSWILELEDIEKKSAKLIQKILFSERQSKSTKNKFEKNDVLYGKLRPYLDKVIIANETGYCTTEIIPIKPGKFLDSRFLFYGLKRKEFIDYVSEVSHGLNMPRLGTRQGQEAPFVLAPLNEQIRIADKLDSVLAKVDAAQARLEKIPTLLKRFRQSVLTAAVSGKLTEDWRESEGLPFPKSICIDEISELVTKGASPKWQGINYVNDSSQTMFVTSENVGVFDLLLDEPKFVEDSFNEKQKRSVLQFGDVLTNIVGASIGRAAIWDRTDKANTNQAVCIIRPDITKCLSKYLCLYLNSPNGVEQLLGNKVDVARANVSLGNIKNLQLSLPSIEEQTEIVRRVESLFTLADTVEKQYLETKKRIDRLTQSLLAKAFHGELVPQDPNDEPAAELLKRIQAERNAQPPVKNKRSKPA
jgi:type I restriction enzyme S subunit